MEKTRSVFRFLVALSACTHSSSSDNSAPTPSAITTAIDAAPSAVAPSVKPDASANVAVAKPAPDAHDSTCRTDADCVVVQKLVVDGGVVSVLAQKDAADAGPTDDGFQDCQDQEVRATDAKGKVTLLARRCTQRDRPLSVTMKDSVLTIGYDGQGVPSTWVGVESAKLSLFPARLLSTTDQFFNRMPSSAPCASQEERTWDQTTLRGGSEWAAACSDHDPCKRHKFTAIPRVDSIGAFVDDWKNISLGSCATTIDAKNGFVVGHPTATLAAVLVGDDLFVDVDDDKIVVAGAARDRLEVWATPDLESYMSPACAADEQPTVTKLATSLEIGDASTRARAHVRLPKGTTAIAMAYFDSDDGTTTKGTVATSALTNEKPRDLGEPVDLKSRGNCRVKSTRLEWEPQPPSASTPLWEP